LVARLYLDLWLFLLADWKRLDYGQMAGMVTLLRARNVWKFGPTADFRAVQSRIELALLKDVMDAFILSPSDHWYSTWRKRVETSVELILASKFAVSQHHTVALRWSRP
ncbi:hypothetical protein, partial [Pseudovibrio sp. Ad14]|uniref:hypothetical protein n=1 Tax=Pseudovibrio sp. Ad14 TaxID=989397 RepID=UPI0019D365C2